MITISLCMVAGDQTEELIYSLESMKDIINEIIIVNIGSNEQIRATCSIYTNRIFNFTQSGDSAACRNYSFSHATKDYIMWLDPGDFLQEADRQKLIRLKAEWDDSIDAIRMEHVFIFNEEAKPSMNITRPRIVKSSKYFKWQSGFDGYLPVTGKVINADIAVTNRSVKKDRRTPGVSIYEYRLESGEMLTPKEMYYYAEKLFTGRRYDKAAEFYKSFLREREGWIGDKIFVCDKLAEFYRQNGDKARELEYSFKSFEYDLPRPEFLCRLGVIFTELNEIHKAIWWYRVALSVEKLKDYLGFMKEEYWTWLPHLKLAACYFRIGDYENAYKHNELALSFKPVDKNLLNNRNSLEGLLKKNRLYASKTQNLIIPNQKRPLKIIQVAPDIYPVPPENYGGIETVIYEITEELVRRGHDVYLYAPEGSKTSAKLIPYQHKGKGDFERIAEYVLKTMPEGVDIIHDHTHISVLGKKELPIPTVCTIHGTINYRVKYPVFVSRRALEVIGGNHGFYVYNGLNLREYEYSEHKDDYMLYLGRLDQYKGLGHALDIADRTNKKLIIAGPVHDVAYYSKEVEPRLRKNPNIKYIGSVGGETKQEVIKHAACLLFPTSWEEPFGLVMIEAMACGTPVVALVNGAVPEVLKGFPDCICRNVDEMVDRVLKAGFPAPKNLREYAVINFSTEKMVDGYLEVYEKVISENKNFKNVNIARKIKETLRIVQVAPDALPVPPTNYGGIERVVFDLTEELVKRGHEVYLFGAEGSCSSAKIIPYIHKGTDANKVAEFVMKTMPEKIDLIHDHTHASVMDKCGLTIPVVSTLHDSRRNSAKNPVYLCKKALKNVGLDHGFYSYNGINPADYEFSESKEDYLVFMGLLYSHKGINFALDVAEKTGQKLVIAGPIYNIDYYRKEIEPRITGSSNIRYEGSVGGRQRQDLLKHARCMLFPTVWEEPFGLVMIEAMACGTPVLAFGNGAVPEVLGGFPELICSDVDEMAEKARKQLFPESKKLRKYVEDNFSAAKMTDRYMEIYTKVIDERV